jgi:hypothetical protein
MRAAFSKTEIESEIASRFGSAFKLHEKRPAEVMSTGLGEVDSFIGGGLPRGAITEVFGPASSGRTSFMLSALAHATERQEVCALVDTNNAFDPRSAAQAEINFARLLWIGCANHLEHAFKSTDLLLQGGGFGLVLLDLGDVPAKSARRIISSWWYRFRRTVENTLTALVVITEESCVRSCASLSLELKADSVWSQAGVRLSEERSEGQENILYPVPRRVIPNSSSRVTIGDLGSVTHANLLRASSLQIERRRPVHPGLKEVRFKAVAQA